MGLYNEFDKMRYLKQVTDESYDYMKYLFGNCAPVEEDFETDLCMFSRDQVVALLKKLNYHSRQTYYVACSRLSIYTSWCKQNELMNKNAINNYAPDLAETIIEELLPIEMMEEKYFTREKFKMVYLDRIEDIGDKMIAYALFNGITKNEIINMRISDLDDKNRKLTLITRRTVEIDDLLVKLIKKANDSQFYNIEKAKFRDRPDLCEYTTSLYVIKQFKRQGHNAPISNNNWFSRLKNIKEQTENPYFDAPNLYNNGLINYIKEHIEVPLSVAFTEIDEIHKNVENFKDDAHLKKKYSKEIQQYIYDYGAKKNIRTLKKEIKDFLYIFD